ncbi:hypothetical protein NP493_148g04069 [Ridgeia piscesae]|uniref:Uncharacterized protein n=1 Tax=Ridgeia piscesae TaxID=27915 RepID=A0AAD9P4T8_RIDPI|nr:hypothetical protein NP493_148g04069 [Ridgeia piscesae]
MRKDNVGEITVKDALILEYGRSLVRRFGNDKEQYGYISGKMRQLGRLLICLHKLCGMKVSLHPSMFQMVVSAAQECYDMNHTYGMPSQAIKSGQLLEIVAEVKLAQALERCDTDAAETNTQFIKLCELEWTQVSATPLRNLSECKQNGVKLLPLTEDVVKLNEHLDSEGSKHASVFEQQSDDTESYAA